MTKEQIGSFVLNERKKQGLSQKALAEKAGFSRYQQILEIEKNQFDYGVDVLIKVLNALGRVLVINDPTWETRVNAEVNEPDVQTSATIFDFSKAEPAKEEEAPAPVTKKKQAAKKPTAIFKRSVQKS